MSDKGKQIDKHKIPTIAFLGDSVTQGCFELSVKEEGGFGNVYDKNSTYHNYVAKILSVLFPATPLNIINAGIAGDNAVNGERRLQRDVLDFKPDLTVVCFALNDSGGGVQSVEKYVCALRKIFERLKEAGSEVIFMTPNMMNTETSPYLKEEILKQIALNMQKIQNEGVLDFYVEAAKKLCSECGVVVCDCYEKWKKLYEQGVNVTELLANKINHPTREMNWLFAGMLVDKMFED